MKKLNMASPGETGRIIPGSISPFRPYAHPYATHTGILDNLPRIPTSYTLPPPSHLIRGPHVPIHP
jgi:hypothetical protein